MYQRVFGSQTRLIAVCAGALVMALHAAPAAADAAKCEQTISKETAKYEIAVQKALSKCQDALAKGKIPGPCPDSDASGKISSALSKFQDKVSGACTSLTPTDIGWSGLIKECNGGSRDGLSCTKNSDCEGQCAGGGEPGAPCTSNGNCPAACVGGSNPGESCKGGGATQCVLDGGACTDLGTCSNPPGGTCDPADGCPSVADDSAPFANCAGPMATITDVENCIVCNTNANANVVTNFAWGARRPPFGNPAFGLPDNGDDGKSLLNCSRTLGKSTGKYFQKIRKATQKCTAGILKAPGGGLLCPDAKMTDAFSKAKAKLDDKISKKCDVLSQTTNLSQVLPLDPLADSLTPLPTTDQSWGDVASSLSNKIGTCSDAFAVPGVLIDTCRSNCGNGQVDPGEDCDDGNVVNGDTCPADCHLNSTCTMNGTKTVTVSIASDDPTVLPLGALQTYLSYDDTKVSLPGTGSGAGVAISSGAFTVAVNDVDYAVTVLLLDPADVGTPPYTATFNVCGAAVVTAADFNCMVLSAADAATATPAYGVTCSVSVM